MLNKQSDKHNVKRVTYMSSTQHTIFLHLDARVDNYIVEVASDMNLKPEKLQ